METRDLVSIITPNYNCERFILETIYSVQSQTYTNWELLIVDDCSTDNSISIIKEIARKDDRIRILSNVQNSGAAESRNYALREAKGKWIAFLDSDDLWMPLKLERQISFMKCNGYSFSYTNSEYVNEIGESLGIIETGPQRVGYFKLLLYNFLSTCSVMYDKDLIGLIQIPNLKKRNDYAIWLIASKRYPCYLLNENLTKYRIRESGSLSGKSKGVLSQKKLLLDHYKMFHESEKFNSLASCIFVGYNIIGYIIKRFLYVKKRK